MKRLFVLTILTTCLLFGFGEKPKAVAMSDFQALQAKVEQQESAIVRQKSEINSLKRALKEANEAIEYGTMEAMEAKDLAEYHEVVIEDVRGALQ